MSKLYLQTRAGILKRIHRSGQIRGEPPSLIYLQEMDDSLIAMNYFTQRMKSKTKLGRLFHGDSRRETQAIIYILVPKYAEKFMICYLVRSEGGSYLYLFSIDVDLDTVNLTSNFLFRTDSIINYVRIHSRRDLDAYFKILAKKYDLTHRIIKCDYSLRLPPTSNSDFLERLVPDVTARLLISNEPSRFDLSVARLSINDLSVAKIKAYEVNNLPDDLVRIHDEEDPLVAEIILTYILKLDTNPLRLYTTGSERRLMESFQQLVQEQIEDENANKLNTAEREMIAKIYNLSESEKANLMVAITKKQKEMVDGCRDSEDLISFENLETIPAPFLIKLPLSNGQFECYNILNITRLSGMVSPTTRQPFSIDLITAIARQLSLIIKFLFQYHFVDVRESET